MKENIVVFGVGKTDVVREYLIDNFSHRILYFVDNNSELWDKTKIQDRFSVFSPRKILEEDRDIDIIITTFNIASIQSIKQQIKKMNINKEIVCYSVREDFYIKFLNWCYIKNNLNPKHLVVEMSSYCNLKCRFCNFHGIENLQAKLSRQAFMTWPILDKIVEQAKKHNSIEKISAFHSGEEFLNKEWFEMLNYMLTQISSLKEFTISTNGMLLTENNILKISKLDCNNIRLFISLSGNSRAECEFLRTNIDYNLVKNNILAAKRLLPNNVHIELHIDYILDKNTLKEANYILDNINFKVPEYIRQDFPNITCIIGPTFLYNPNYKLYGDILEKENLSVVKIKSLITGCQNLFNLVCIDSLGYVLNCCCNGGYIRLGNVMSEDFTKLWNQHHIMNNAREIMLKTGMSPKFCENCGYNIGGEAHVIAKKAQTTPPLSNF